MIVRATYASKASGPLGAVAPVRKPMAPCTTTRSFFNEHLIGWPMGTGGNLQE
ncbi:MAG: hypothetical protein LC799_20800 [Actinobacteria bacterium]|nr:hypothetical protein [Actinomycetota bacterium]